MGLSAHPGSGQGGRSRSSQFEKAAVLVGKDGVPLGGAGRGDLKWDEEENKLAASYDHLVAIVFQPF